MKPRALVYIRTRIDSPDALATEEAVTEQLDACLEEIDQICAVMVEYYCDINTSANDMGRTGLNDLLRRVESPEKDIDLVVVTSADQLAEKTSDGMTVHLKIHDAGARLHVIESSVERRAA